MFMLTGVFVICLTVRKMIVSDDAPKANHTKLTPDSFRGNHAKS